jgi:hypothetical protein
VAGDNEKSVIEDAIIDADLFLKYRMVDRAIGKLREVAALFPSNTDLRWKLADLYMDQQAGKSAAEELVALANIYLSLNQYDFARLALLKLREIYPDAPQVVAWIATLDQKQKLPESSLNQRPARPITHSSLSILAGDLAHISLFDIIQAVEKNNITGILYVNNEEVQGTIYFNKGLVADAVIGSVRGKAAFKLLAEITEGSFEMERSPVEFQTSIQATSNAQVILDIFAEEESEEESEKTTEI